MGAGHVTRLEYEGRQIHIVGTAHISQQSVEEVRAVIAELQPDTVCVELDPMRYEALTDESRWQRLDIFQVVKDKKVLFVLTNLVLGAYQRKLGDAMGVQPGAEMLAAIESAEEIGAELILADRDIQATLKRTWRRLSFWSKGKVVSSLIASFFAAEKITAEQIEELKDKDHVSEAMREMAKAFPQVQGPLIDERDRYLISSIREAPGTCIVAVVGAGHVEGMVRHLETPVDRDALCQIPPPSRLGRAVAWLIPIVVLSAFAYGYQQHSGEDFRQMLYAWILPNSIVAAALGMVAAARPLTVLTAFVASPITSLNPTIGAGMVAGLVEAWLRKPTVEDCARVAEDAKTIRGIYRNPFTRVLLVAVLTTVGSAIGGWIGASWVVSLL